MKIVAACWMLLLFICGVAAGATGGVRHAETCGRCHRDILTAWKQSVHSRALENTLFQDALERAEQIGGESSRRVCLGCHAPTVRYSGDWELEAKSSWEGVTCDFCHSVKSVSMAGISPELVARFDGVKTGPLKDAVSTGHETAFSDVHTTSLICAGCHEYRNAKDFPVLTTYSEWQSSSYAAQQKSCQNCHMGEVEADVVDPRVKRVDDAKVNLHEMPGSRSIQMLNEAVQLSLRDQREGDELIVTVTLRNRGAGHMIPTGSPLRKLNVIVEVKSGGKTYEQRRVYQRKVADESGAEITKEERIFLRAAKQLSDTRLKPEESREEVFRFPVPAKQSARMDVRVLYVYSPNYEKGEQQSVTFIGVPRYIRPEL